MKIAVLGVSGSGKSTFGEVANYQFNKGFKGYNAKKVIFPKLMSGKKNLKDIKPTTRRYVVKIPLYKKVPLREREHLLSKDDKWELIDTIQWEDYKGESIQAGKAEWLVTAIKESDGIIMIIDAEELDSELRNKGKSDSRNEEYAIQHIEMLAELVNEVEGDCPPIAIVLTKYDKVDKSTIENTPNKLACEVTNILSCSLIDREKDYEYETFLSSKENLRKYPPAMALHWLIEKIIVEQKE